MISAHEAHASESPLLASHAADIEVVKGYAAVDQSISMAEASVEVAFAKRNAVAEHLKEQVAGWALRFKKDHPSFRTRNFVGLRDDALLILKAGRELLRVATGDEPYLEDLHNAVQPAVDACDDAIEAVRFEAMHLRMAQHRRRDLAMVIEPLRSPYRYALAILLGHGAPPERALSLPRPRRVATSAEVEAAQANASSVSLVVDTGDTADPPTDPPSDVDAGFNIEGASAHESNEAA